MRMMISVGLLLLGVGVAVGQQIEHTKDKTEDVKKAVAEKKAVLVDVREESEWNDGHLKNAILFPLTKLKDAKVGDLPKELKKDTPVYVHCAAGRRALKAAEKLKELGYDVRALKPGYEDLLKAGFEKAEKK